MDIKDYLAIGLSGEKQYVVQETDSAPHVGSGEMRVLATPRMIAFMELTSRLMLDEYLPEGYTTVGTMVHVWHKAPSAVGAVVRAITAVKEIDGSKVLLEVAVWDGDTLVGEGTHERFVIDKARFIKRLNNG
ncbi:MAG: thioesterase family protein [Anaerolineae bacterium]|nr:thioesterase family protein [Anaerolineae bacterium]